MRKTLPLLLLSSTLAVNAQTSSVKINEFVTDPKSDHNTNGYVTLTDEFVELFNASSNDVDISGWRLDFLDSSPTNTFLSGTIYSNGFYLIQNPPNAINDNGEIRLSDSSSNLVDSISYGNWTNSTIGSGNANSPYDESHSRYPNASTNWVRTVATPGFNNYSSSPPRLSLKEEIIGELNILTATNTFPGKKFVLQSSQNFDSWGNIVTNLSTSNFLIYTQDFDINSPLNIFRLKLYP